MAKENCNDKNCPIHGSLSVRGRTFNGIVASSKASKSAVVEWGRLYAVPKYERYEKRKTRIMVHNPLCINAKEGDFVEIKECRPLSKTKKFVITAILTEKVKTNIAVPKLSTIREEKDESKKSSKKVSSEEKPKKSKKKSESQ